MNQAFSMTDLGLLSQFLGLEDCSNQSWNQGAPVQICLGFSDQIQNARLQSKQKTPFLSGVKLEDKMILPPMVNNTLYRQLIGCFCI